MRKRGFGVGRVAGVALIVAGAIACDDGAVVGNVGAPNSGTTNPASEGTRTQAIEGVPAGAELGGTIDWYDKKVQAYATFEADGKTLKEFGIVMSMASVSKIPPGSFTSQAWIDLPPSVAKQTYVQSFQLNFLPAGHPPARVYDKPHIDTHAYAWTKPQVTAITCTTKNDFLVPPADMLPPGDWTFDPSPAAGFCLPSAGLHGLNVAAPEFNGQAFTKSSNIIVADGAFLAYEPKFTVEVMNARKDFDIDLPAPPKLATTTKAPTTYRATYLPSIDGYRIAYANLVTVSQ